MKGVLVTPIFDIRYLGSFHILNIDVARLANPGECGGRKPREERGCHLQACTSNWFTGEWGRCEAGCGEVGERGREVQCLLDGSPATSCRLSERPAIRENCQTDCPAEKEGTNGPKERERDEVEQMEEEREEEEEELLEELLEVEDEKGRKRKGSFAEENRVGAVVTVIEDNRNIQLGGEESKEEMFENNVEVEMSNEILVENQRKGRRGPACRDKFKNCQVALFTIVIFDATPFSPVFLIFLSNYFSQI